jgi:hypothetical protein
VAADHCPFGFDGLGAFVFGVGGFEATELVLLGGGECPLEGDEPLERGTVGVSKDFSG